MPRAKGGGERLQRKAFNTAAALTLDVESLTQRLNNGAASGDSTGTDAYMRKDDEKEMREDKNPFSHKQGSREPGLRPKTEIVYEERPWTPSTGEDYLLSAQPSFYPSSTIYPRRQSKVQRIVGARRAAYYADAYERGANRIPHSSSPVPVRLQPIKVAPLRDDGFVPIQKKVLIKDHARNSMTEYQGIDDASRSFASLALTLETELLEFKNIRESLFTR